MAKIIGNDDDDENKENIEPKNIGSINEYGLRNKQHNHIEK